MEFFLQDLKHAFRMFRQNRVFTAATVAALALGIRREHGDFLYRQCRAAEAAAVPEPDRRGVLMSTAGERLRRSAVAVAGQVRALRPADDRAHRTRTAYRTNVVNYTGGAFPEQLQAGAGQCRATSALWSAGIPRPYVLARRKIAGRPAVAVLSQGLWRRRFGERSGIIGKTILLSGDPCTK